MGSFILTSAQPVLAANAQLFNAGRIIDDAIFTNNNSMSAAQIQDFLNSKNSTCLKNFQTLSLVDYNNDGQVQETTTEAYGKSGNMSAAQVIKAAADIYKINPQVILVTLEKEQGLVTRKDCPDWRYNTALGYGCPDTAPCNQAAYGFTRQIDYGVFHFRGFFDDSLTTVPFNVGSYRVSYNPTASCGSSVVNIQNRATAALYSYTPYQPNQAALDAGYGLAEPCGAYGNRNFYLYFTDWFGTTLSGQYPSPLYKSSSSDSIYAVIGNTKYRLASFDVIRAYGLKNAPVTTVSDAYLSSYTTGVTISSTVAKKSDDPSGTLYMFDDGKRYPIPINACKYNIDGTPITTDSSWQIDCFNSNVSLALPNQFIDYYTVQDIAIPNLVIYDGAVWKIQDGKRNRITDGQFVDILGGWGSVREIQSINIPRNQGKMLILDESLVKFSDSPTIYYLVNAKLYRIVSPEILSAYRLGAKTVYNFPVEFNTEDPIEVNPEPLTFFAKDSRDTPFLLLLNGTKASLNGSAGKWDTAPYSLVPDYVLNQVSTTSLSPVLRSQSGTIFTVQNDKKYVFPTVDDIVYSGFSTGQIQSVANEVEALFNYGGSRLSAGRLFKVSGSDTIRYVFNEANSLAVYSTNKPGLPYDKLITVDAVTGTRYQIIGTL